MGDTSKYKEEKQIALGILAHVDAGKTTLSESMLHKGGIVDNIGRVDKKNAFLDNYELEKERGITIFSKQAVFRIGNMRVTLLDTPGHIDFSAEMERTLQVLDYAVLVINGADGVQGHTRTLWRLLERYQIPVFLFINKMDQFKGNDEEKQEEQERLLASLQKELSTSCLDFGGEWNAAFLENLALCEEEVLEHYLESGEVEEADIVKMVAQRKVFPCYFGSALKEEGVDKFLKGVETYTAERKYGDKFAARVFKIARDAQGNRLTYLKVTGGVLKVKMLLKGENRNAEETEIWEEKVDQIRIYSGARYEMVKEAKAGMVCAVTGLNHTFAGEGLGLEEESTIPLLEPVLSYKIELPPECDAHQMLRKLRQLEEEEPQLHIVWEEQSSEIHAKLMGDVQIEILQSLIRERFGVDVSFGEGSIVYKETIAGPVEGIGHFEPLRHYAEVHLLLEPLERGSGVQFDTDCSEDLLDRNWQRLILTHLEEKRHVGVLTGSELTDLRILLIAGKAHTKHTEGGDFRQATYRAVRQGMRSGKSILLEPWFSFRLEVPTENLGRAMSDITRMNGSFEAPETEGNNSVLTGSVPVASMGDYGKEVASYTKGHGRLSCTLKGYEPCHNPEEVMAEIGYDPEADVVNPTGSVFCAHGAGFQVSWDQVPEYAHVESGWKPEKEGTKDADGISDAGLQAVNRQQGAIRQTGGGVERIISQEEIEEIFRQTYGKKAEDPHRFRRYHTSSGNRGSYTGSLAGSAGDTGMRKVVPQEKPEEYLLVDGYNIIFAWPELRELAKINLDSARDKLMDILCNYQGYQGCRLILVYDAYKVKDNPGSTMKYHNIEVVYTKEAETADQYIERTTHQLGAKPQKYRVTVATSDALEQMIIWGNGATRMSALGLKAAVEAAGAEYFK